MAHVNPTLSNASRAMYTLPATRRTNNPDRGGTSGGLSMFDGQPE